VLYGGDYGDQIYVRDCATGAERLVSVSSTGEAGNDVSERPSVSADGRFVAFQSLAINFHWNVWYDSSFEVYLHDRDTDGDGVFDEQGVSHEVVNLGAMILVVRQALVHLRALQVGEASTDLIHGGAVDVRPMTS
jgi:hypothetical protein